MEKKLLNREEKENYCRYRDRKNREFDDRIEPIKKKIDEYEIKISKLLKQIDEINSERAEYHIQHKKDYGFDINEKMW